ncbi:MAG: RAMP superfamily CRISPR-associated protein [Dehalococcoidia bacterium]
MTLRIGLKFRTVSPLLPGSGESREAADILIVRRADGTPLLRGSSLAGVLRGQATRIAPLLGEPLCHRLSGRQDWCPCSVCILFGPQRITEAETDRATQSRLLVYDIPLAGETRVRDGVAIARGSGSADRAGAAKFDYETLPAGTEFEAVLELQTRGEPNPANETRVRILLLALLTDLRRRHAITVGHGRGRGMGLVSVDSFSVTDLSGGARLLDRIEQGYFGSRGVPATLGDAADILPLVDHANEAGEGVLSEWLRFDLTLACEGSYLSNDPLAAALVGFDGAPAWEKASEAARALLDGGSLRGVLRSRAEYIARSLWQWEADGEPVLAACPACYPTGDDRDAPLARCSLLWEGKPEDAAEPQLCLACRLFGSSLGGSRLLVAAGAAVAPHRWKPLEHLAIDRFTGGGREGLKFDSWVAWKPRFSVSLYLESPAAWEVGWLVATLRDVLAGRVTIGGRNSEGHGWCSATEVQITGGWSGPAVPFWLDGCPLEGREGLFRTHTGVWHAGEAPPAGLEAALGDFRRQVQGFVRTGTLPKGDGVGQRQREIYFAHPAS